MRFVFLKLAIMHRRYAAPLSNTPMLSKRRRGHRVVLSTVYSFLLMETKQCFKCGLVLPVTAFNPRKPRPSGTYKDGYDYRCKYCRSEYDKVNRKWKQKYEPVDERTLIKVRETEKHYFSENEILYMKLKVGFRKCKGDFISSNGKQMRVDKLRQKYFEIA